jgi:dTDP-glucose pyrophosphorylase
MNIVIPMAGRGERFSSAGYTLPKPLIPIQEKPMIQVAVESIGQDGNYIFIIQNNDTIYNTLKSVYPNSQIIQIDYITDGPASTCLLAKKYINNNDPLLIFNCDQIMWWDKEAFSTYIKHCNYDGIVVTYPENTSKNSYAKLDRSGHVIKVAEKEVISNISLNGIHFWKKGYDFVNSAEKMISVGEKYNNEFYVGPSYNSLINQNKKIGIYHIPKEQHHAVGTPEDLLKYIDKLCNYENF